MKETALTILFPSKQVLQIEADGFIFLTKKQAQTLAQAILVKWPIKK